MSRVELAFSAAEGPEGAPYLILGHSLGTSSYLWDRTTGELAKRFRVAPWELPGHGAAPPARTAFSVEEVVKEIIAHLDEIGIERAYYAGVSFGGTVGLELALSYPERISAIAIISSGACVDDVAAWFSRAAAVRQDGTRSLVKGSRQRWFADLTRRSQANRVDALVQILESTDDASYAWACEALAEYDAIDRLDQLEPPVLAVWGEEDALVPEAKLREISDRVRHGHATGIADAAHAAPFERPQAVAELLATFFSGLSRPKC